MAVILANTYLARGVMPHTWETLKKQLVIELLMGRGRETKGDG